MPFLCSICEEESTRICVSCTKDACGNHLCDRCGRCSDCCSCGITLDEHPHVPKQESAGSLRSPGLLDVTASELKVAGHGSEGILDSVLLVNGNGASEAGSGDD